MTDGPSSVVIVGGGLAGAKTADALREQGYRNPVTILTAEDELPYERPPLSKDYLQGSSAFDDALVHPREWYDEHDVTVRTGTEVVAVRTASHEVELRDGERVPYGALVLATGSEPRVLPIPGADAALVLRTRADADALQAAIADGSRVVIIGAGWIGLEVAAAARKAGAEVTVLDSAELPLLAVLGREMAEVFAALHRENGVDLRLGVAIAEVADRRRDRRRRPALRRHRPLGRRRARRNDASYANLPYFFSDQYDLGMEYVGLVGPGSYARVIVRGDLAGREFVALWLDADNHVLAGMNVNVWDVVDDVKALITGRTVVDPDRLGDPAVPLAEVAWT